MSRAPGGPPGLAAWIVRRLSVFDEMFAIADDFESEYRRIRAEKGPGRARLWAWACAFRSAASYIPLTTQWSLIMFTNYLKVAWRNIRRHKGFAFINIAGLAMGVAAGLLVLIYVGDELRFDRFHAKADRIYRIAQKIHIDNRVDSALPGPPILAAALAKDFPEIESTARLNRIGGAIVRVQDRGFGKPEVYAANSGFFEVFSFRLVDGDPKTALAEPNTVILTRSAAERCFRGENPMGRVMTIGEMEFKVAGIMENVPRNSHFHFEFLTSDITYPRSRRTGWFEGFCATYVVLKKEPPRKLWKPGSRHSPSITYMAAKEAPAAYSRTGSTSFSP